MSRLLIFLSIFLFSLAVRAAEFPRANAVPGGIVVVPLGTDSNQAPRVYFQGHRVLVEKHHNQWQAVVGLPLSIKPGTHSLSIKGKQTTKLAFAVNAKTYPAQHITLKNKRMVNPNKQDLTRIFREKKIILAALKHWRDSTPTLQQPFLMPVSGIISSTFGLRRFFNGQPRKPHSGLDIAAPQGTPIYAPADGRVIEAGKYFFDGNTIFLDHGQGLVTMYCHLKSIDVKKGQFIKRGQRFATVGRTGRVTGPHLHWSVSLNDARVDPRLFLAPK